MRTAAKWSRCGAWSSAVASLLFGVACAESGPVNGTTGTSTTSSAGGAGAATGSGGGTGGAAASSGGAGAGGGAGASSSASSASGGASDPCAGAADGAHCGADLGGMADHASLYVCSGGQTSSVMGCANGCSGGACVQPPADPCGSAQSGNGAYCGSTLAGGDAGALYQCQNGATQSKTTCPAGCKVNPPGTADACNPQGDPCANAGAGNGAYCGGSIGGAPNVLYQCQNGSTQSQTTCAAGCKTNPPGTPDACNPVGGGQCCVNKPPGVLTQSYSACGNGGSHYGVDLGTAIGTPIYAGISGTVVGSALGFPNCYNNGCSQSCWNAFNYVKLKSDCGDPQNAGKDFYVYYLHIDGLAPGIGNGSHVDQGQLLAHSGNSGCSSGPHIHLETVSVNQGAGASLNTCNSVNPTTRYCN